MAEDLEDERQVRIPEVSVRKQRERLGITQSDIRHVSQHDVKEDADAEKELELLRALGLDGQSDIAEVGAGTGQFALAAAAECGRVIAVDVSPVMLDVLKGVPESTEAAVTRRILPDDQIQTEEQPKH